MRPSLLLPVFLLFSAAAPADAPTSVPPGLRDGTPLSRVPERLELPALDQARLRAEDAKDRAAGKPPRYAVPVKTRTITPAADGAWETLNDGTRVWRYRILAEGATSVEPAFTEFHLPEGATLYVHGNDGRRVRGPYTHADNRSHGELWVPIVEGDRATIELELEPGVARDAVRLAMTQVLQGYEAFWEGASPAKDHGQSLPCSIDVACKKDEWGNPIRSAARITVGGALCTGQMVNDTAFSGRPLFLTARHCGVTDGSAPGLKVYWNFENSQCRDPGTPGAAGPGDGEPLDDAQEGARLLAAYVSSDFALVELDDDPDPEFNVYWTGWDRRDRTFGGGAGIHHPFGEEKRITFEQHEFEIIDGSDTQGLIPSASDRRPRSHFRVVWDQGVTERGSSGSGLWNNQKRLVGQLHGGAHHQCGGNDNFDWYGRFWMSWEGGGTLSSSLEPWLDPLGTGDRVLDGRDSDCNLPNVAIPEFGASPLAGEAVTLSAEGGGPNVRFLWDVDGDGVMDAEGREVETRFAGAGEREIRLIASNPDQSCGTTLSRAVVVRAPELEVSAVGEPFQVGGRGDGDAVIEPGERWGVRVALKNTGNAPALNPRAVFTDPGGRLGSIGPDGFGYTATTSLISPACPYQFVGIGGTNDVSFQPSSPGFPGNDDGGSAAIEMNDFRFYGADVPAIVMSSNGYLAPSAARTGGDFSNDCPLPARVDNDPILFPETGHARLAAYHDDLVTNAAFQKRFATCPRPDGTPNGTGACRIFQWNSVEVLPDDPPFDPLPLEPFDFQAILYEGSNQVVYQYGPDAPTELSTPTVGIQNNTGTQGLTWGCDGMDGIQAPVRPNANSAVCFYHPDSQPSSPLEQPVMSLLTPAVAYGNIPAGGTEIAPLEFEIDADAVCGAEFAISLHGLVFDGGFSRGPGTFLTGRVGGDDVQCDAGMQAASAKADIDFRPGLYFNLDRDGHGVDIHTAGNQASLIWFTYGPDRQPVWYLAVGAYEDNQISTDLLRFTDSNVDDPEVAGEVIVTFIDETTALFNWTLDGRAGGELLDFIEFGQGPPPDQRTGLWSPKAPSEDGWGMTVNTQGDSEVGVVYFYDDQGQPVWVLGAKSAAGKVIDLDQFKGVCPGCDWTSQTLQAAGSLERDFSDVRNGTLETDITLGPPLEGTWARGPLGIRILSDPVGE